MTKGIFRAAGAIGEKEMMGVEIIGFAHQKMKFGRGSLSITCPKSKKKTRSLGRLNLAVERLEGGRLGTPGEDRADLQQGAIADVKGEGRNDAGKNAETANHSFRFCVERSGIEVMNQRIEAAEKQGDYDEEGNHRLPRMLRHDLSPMDLADQQKRQVIRAAVAKGLQIRRREPVCCQVGGEAGILDRGLSFLGDPNVEIDELHGLTSDGKGHVFA